MKKIAIVVGLFLALTAAPAAAGEPNGHGYGWYHNHCTSTTC